MKPDTIKPTSPFSIPFFFLIGGVLRFLKRYIYQKKKERSFSPLHELLSAFNTSAIAPEILLLGDSVMERVSRTDGDKRALKIIISDLLKKKGILASSISFSAYTLEMYYLFIQILKKCTTRPRLIALPINLRSFSPQWDNNPTYHSHSHISEIARFLELSKNQEGMRSFVLKRHICKYLFTDINYPDIPLKKHYQIVGRIFSKQNQMINDTVRRRLIFIYHYLYPISPTHHKLEFVRRIISETASLGIRVFFYIVPINYQGGKTLIGDQLTIKINHDVTVITGIISTSGPHVIIKDYSRLLAIDDFFSPFEAAEHCNQSGRKKLAKTLSEDIASFYRSENK